MLLVGISGGTLVPNLILSRWIVSITSLVKHLMNDHLLLNRWALLIVLLLLHVTHLVHLLLRSVNSLRRGLHHVRSLGRNL